jgi:predicted Fe-Mo cluster-binding NifX family protein
MTIAMKTLLLTTWNGRISPVLDVARQAELVTADAEGIASRTTVKLPGKDPEGQAEALRALKPQVLVCGAVSRPLASLLMADEIQLVPFRTGAVDEIIEAWLQGHLDEAAILMPGCRGRRMGWCQGRGRGRQGRHGGAGRARRRFANPN